MSRKTLYGKTRAEDISPYVIFSGDPQRVEMVQKYLTNAKHISYAREFNTYTGSYKGVPITVTSTGIGAPGAAIAMEEMYECGMEVALRMGTTMSLADNYLGHFLIPVASISQEGTSQTYVPPGFPAVADFDMVQVLQETTALLGAQSHTCLSCTKDGFYSEMHESRLSRERAINMNGLFEDLKKLGVTCIDMESSAMMNIGRLMGVRTAVLTVATVLENLKSFLEGDERTAAEDMLCRIALESLYRLESKENK